MRASVTARAGRDISDLSPFRPDWGVPSRRDGRALPGWFADRRQRMGRCGGAAMLSPGRRETSGRRGRPRASGTEASPVHPDALRPAASFRAMPGLAQQRLCRALREADRRASQARVGLQPSHPRGRRVRSAPSARAMVPLGLWPPRSRVEPRRRQLCARHANERSQPPGGRAAADTRARRACRRSAALRRAALRSVQVAGEEQRLGRIPQGLACAYEHSKAHVVFVCAPNPLISVARCAHSGVRQAAKPPTRSSTVSEREFLHERVHLIGKRGHTLGVAEAHLEQRAVPDCHEPRHRPSPIASAGICALHAGARILDQA